MYCKHLCTTVDYAEKTASGNRLCALLLLWYPAIWSSVSTQASLVGYSTLPFMEEVLWYL